MNASDGSIGERALVDPDYNNFAPRFGFAYEVTSNTVLRGGYGLGYIHFNRLASAGLLATNYPVVTRATMTQSLPRNSDGSPAAVLCSGDAYTNCFRATQQGYPPNLPNNVVLHIPRDTPAGQVQSWHVSVQQKLTDRLVAELAYVGNDGRNLSMLADLNQARPPLPGEDPNSTLAARRPIAGFGTISAVLPEAFSNYRALQARVEYRSSASLYLLNSFTWSRAEDNVSQVLEDPNGSTGTPQNVYDIGADRGPSGYDVPLLNVTSFVWNLPFGRGHAYANDLPIVLEGLVGGWQLSGIHTMRSGRTVNLRYNTSGPTPVTSGLPSFLGGVNLQAERQRRPAGAGIGALDRQLLQPRQHHAAAGHPAVRQRAPQRRRAATPSTSSTSGCRSSFRSRPERRRDRGAVEAFNVLNKTNFGAPNGDRSSARSAPSARQFPTHRSSSRQGKLLTCDTPSRSQQSFARSASSSSRLGPPAPRVVMISMMA